MQTTIQTAYAVENISKYNVITTSLHCIRCNEIMDDIFNLKNHKHSYICLYDDSMIKCNNLNDL